MSESLLHTELLILVPGTSPAYMLEYIPKAEGEKPMAKEKRLEKEFGESLSDQGILVQYQVHCEYGIADIVTPDAVYEVKASLSRGDIYRAASQVLLYRNCINPSARAIIVGYPNNEEPVNIEIATALGIEVIVCRDTVAEKQKENKKGIKSIEFEYAMSHLICIHRARFDGYATHAYGYIEGYTQPITIVRGDNKQSAQELMDQIKDQPWCNVNLLRDGRFYESLDVVDTCPCSVALEKGCSCPRHKPNIDFPDFPQMPLSQGMIELFKNSQAKSNEETKELLKPFSVENLRSYRESKLQDIRWAEEEDDALALFGFTEDLKICEAELRRKLNLQ
jgi:hypothetical protein